MSIWTKKKSLEDKISAEQERCSRLLYELGQLAYRQAIDGEESRKLIQQLKEVNKRGAELSAKLKPVPLPETKPEPGEPDGSAQK